MSLVERASISGTALSYLLSECIAAESAQEGFLLGSITSEITNQISDSQQENCHTEVIINVTSMLPGPDTGFFYSPSGKIKENVLQEMLSDSSSRVIGWYKYRRNNSLKPTMRDRIISKELRKYFDRRDCKYFVCCNITCKQYPGNATHSFSYRFSKINRYGDLETLQDVTNNLGETVSGYKRGIRGDRDDPFNRVVNNCNGNGITEIARAVENALSASAAETVRHETAIREISSEIDHMLELLASHYRHNHPVLQAVRGTEALLKEERALIQPLTMSLNAAPAQPTEFFGFVRDMMDNDLKQTAKSSDHREAPSSSNSDVKVENKISGHKRIHSEGAPLSLKAMDKEKSDGTRNRKTGPDHSNTAGDA